MRRLSAIVPLLAIALSCPAAGRPAGEVVGGSRIQIQAAPWTVFVRAAAGSGALLCSGSILDSLHVLTAAHCVYDLSGNLVAPTAIGIRAGISSTAAPLGTDAEQDRDVSSLRVHPGYAWSQSLSPDDAAILALTAPLDLSGPAVQAVALPAPGAAFPAHVPASVAGFGREVTGATADGSLNSLTPTIDDQGSCGVGTSDATAVGLCASSPAGSLCHGDSGAGLVTSDTRTIVGVANAAPASCGPGTRALFTFVGAPEILRFIQGEDHPPLAPRRTPATFVRLSWDGLLRAGSTLTCESGGWDGEPRLDYAFENAATGDLLQQGKPTYLLRASDVGLSISCTAFATNDGGTGVLHTAPTPAIGAAPHVTIDPVGSLAGVRGRRIRLRVVLDAEPGLTGRFGVCITPPANVGGRVCTSQVESDYTAGRLPFTLGLRIKPTAPLGTARLAITAVAGIARAHRTAVVRIARS